MIQKGDNEMMVSNWMRIREHLSAWVSKRLLVHVQQAMHMFKSKLVQEA